jgi:hypothetical protein
MILVAAPYRSGTGGDPDLIAANVEAERAEPGFDHDDAIFHPVAERVLARSDACLRIGGPFAAADRMVEAARRLGKPVYPEIEQIT